MVKMINIPAFAGRLSFISSSVAPASMVNIVQTRFYSQFPKHYLPPVFKKSEQAALVESGKAAEIAHQPILPAKNSETSSEFHDEALQKFTNYLMREGKKQLARSLMESTFEHIKRIQLNRFHKSAPELRDTIELDPLTIFHRAVENSMPTMELLKTRRGGVTYQVPAPILLNRQRFFGMNWLIDATKTRTDRHTHFPELLARELINAAHNEGRVVKKKQDLHRQCEANRAYAHFRWS